MSNGTITAQLLSPPLLRKILEQVNKTPDPFVQFSKPLGRVIVMELIRFLEMQTAQENEKAYPIQRLTMEYACLHICDLLIGLMDTDMEGLKLPDLLQFAIKQIEELANESSIKPEGTA